MYAKRGGWGGRSFYGESYFRNGSDPNVRAQVYTGLLDLLDSDHTLAFLMGPSCTPRATGARRQDNLIP